MNIVKLEIIIDSIYLSALVELMDECAIGGYTGIAVYKSKGHRTGEQIPSGILETKNIYIFSLVNPDQLQCFKENCDEFIRVRKGAYFVTPVLEIMNIKMD